MRKKKKQFFKEKSIVNKNIFEKISLYYNIFKDKIIIYTFERRIFTAVLIIIYIFRIITTSGYACLTYCIGIHVLNSFTGFISPLDDPEENGLESDESILNILIILYIFPLSAKTGENIKETLDEIARITYLDIKDNEDEISKDSIVLKKDLEKIEYYFYNIHRKLNFIIFYFFIDIN